METTRTRTPDSNDARLSERDFARERERRAVTLILLVGLGLRMWQLDIKPVHFDEGINGHFVARIWNDGFYTYDPTNFHGPLYFYFLQLAEILFGWGIKGYRFMTGLMSVAAIGVIAAHRKHVGRAAVWAAALVAISPAFVFYSRYAIHESLFILAQVSFSYGYLTWRRDRSAFSVWVMVAGLIASIATKETFFIFFGTWFIAVALVELAEKFWPAASERSSFVRRGRPLAQGEKIAIAVVALFSLFALFTGFFARAQGAIDLFQAFAFWSKTGTGPTGHEKSFFYYLGLLAKYEWPFLLAVILAPWVFFYVSKSARILVLVGLGTALAYSLIPYKTPWLVLNLLWPLAFTFGHIARGTLAGFVKRPALKWLAIALVFVTSWHAVQEMLRLNFHDFSKPGEPYVYVQSTLEFKRAVDIIDKAARAHPEVRNYKIAVVNRESWPLPYLLIPYPNASYGEAEKTELVGADVILSDASDRLLVEAKMKGSYWMLPFQIRDSYQKGQAYFLREKFGAELVGEAVVIEGGQK